MGLTCVLWRVYQSDTHRLLNASEREVTDFLFGTPLGTPGPKPAKGLRGWFNAISPIKIETFEDYLDEPRGPSGARAELDLDKAWHGLHFLFTGTAWEGEPPASFLVQGGRVLGAEPSDESIPRVLARDEVDAFATFLGRVSRDDLVSRYDPKEMMALKIYPEIWDRADQVEQNLAYLLSAFEDLKRFANEAKVEGDELVVMVT